MSGMKFRRTCSACNATFFSPDRKATLCAKCMKKRAAKHMQAAQARATAQPTRFASASNPQGAQAVRPQKGPRLPRSTVLTPEIRQRIIEVFQAEYANSNRRLREVHARIAEKLWVKRKLVADVLRELAQTQIELAPELRERAIEMYRRFVETGYRPEGGRRRVISKALGIPYRQVAAIIREWSFSEYAKSPTPTLSRQQLFEVEKAYWREIEQQRYRLTELPDRIAEQLGYATRWQILRWLDVLHDDERLFAGVPDPPPEVQQKIIDQYKEYLALPAPPEQGLHFTIAQRIGTVTPRQVHKVLQSYRHRRRAEYPLL
jgi:HD-GYP domain-containing protein (c-di-GMP phosphodiesterase class II)